MVNSLATLETEYLLRKRTRNDNSVLSVCGGACFAFFGFFICYGCIVFSLRYSNATVAFIIGIGFPLLGALALGAIIQYLRKRLRGYRWALLSAIGVTGGCAAGYVLGQGEWWAHTIYYYNYRDMASYTNVDPGLDVGQSFMDAGIVYFKESTYVLTDKAIAFKNGQTYCVAPIVRAPVQLLTGQSNPNILNTVTGFSVPRSGTIDFWAVGIDCCGKTGTDKPFTCGDTQSAVARSGTRVLKAEERAMYLLAVQEWSASTGLPVRHPIFFRWSKDPLADEDSYLMLAESHMYVYCAVVFLVALLVLFLIQFALKKFQIRHS